MKVAKADPVIHGLLSEEQRRCREILQALQTKADKLPKGALNVRRKQVQGKEYLYHYLVVNDRHNGATDFRRNGASEKG